jgi:hypothetical protein
MAIASRGLTCIFYDRAMRRLKGSGPDPETIANYIKRTWPETVVLEMTGTWFFSLDEKHWPNFATIVTTDEHDGASNLARPGVFRLNIGVDRPTFNRVAESAPEPDYTALDRWLPHPVYGKQLWISILNPSTMIFEESVSPLLELAHDRLANVPRRRARQAATA